MNKFPTSQPKSGRGVFTRTYFSVFEYNPVSRKWERFGVHGCPLPSYLKRVAIRKYWVFVGEANKAGAKLAIMAV